MPGPVQKQVYGLHDLLGAFGQPMRLDWDPNVKLTLDVSSFLTLPAHIATGFGLISNGDQYRVLTVPDGEFWIVNHLGYYLNIMAADQLADIDFVIIPASGIGQYGMGDNRKESTTTFDHTATSGGGRGMDLGKLVLTSGDAIGIQSGPRTAWGAGGTLTINAAVNAQRLHI